MCNCLFCGQEMEAEENVDNPHVCPPDENMSLQSVRVAMNEIFDKEDDGWEAWAQLVEWLNKQSAQKSVQADAKACEQTFHQLMKLQGKLFCCDCGLRL